MNKKLYKIIKWTRAQGVTIGSNEQTLFIFNIHSIKLVNKTITIDVLEMYRQTFQIDDNWVIELVGDRLEIYVPE